MSDPIDLRSVPQHPPASPQTSPVVDTQKTPLSQSTKEPQSLLGNLWDILRYALIAAVIIIPIRIFIAQPFIVSGKSMHPTFRNGEYLIVDELTRRYEGYERGDVVILHYPNDPSLYYIKRVIGLPGETITITNGVTGITKPDGTSFTLSEPYVKNPKADNLSKKLTETEFFVMGDNRAQSSDSRVWGPVPLRLMDGKALLRLFPPTRIELHPGAVEKFTDRYETIL